MAVTLTAAMGFLAIMATKAASMDFSVAGQTLSIGADSDINYTTGVEEWEWELTPSAGLTAMGIGLSVATDIDMLELEEGDIFQGLDFTAKYEIPSTFTTLYTEISTEAAKPIKIPKNKRIREVEHEYELIDKNNLEFNPQSAPTRTKTLSESFKEYLFSSLKQSYKYITNNKSI